MIISVGAGGGRFIFFILFYFFRGKRLDQTKWAQSRQPKKKKNLDQQDN